MMQWVQESIEHFGGDPAAVTLMGLSAGAHSVSQVAIFARLCKSQHLLADFSDLLNKDRTSSSQLR
jgi:carboxylesterase type B